MGQKVGKLNAVTDKMEVTIQYGDRSSEVLLHRKWSITFPNILSFDQISRSYKQKSKSHDHVI